MLTIDAIATLTNITEDDGTPVVILRASDGDLVQVGDQIGIFESADMEIVGNNGDIIAYVVDAPTARPADRDHDFTGLPIFRTSAAVGEMVAVMSVDADYNMTALICTVESRYNGRALTSGAKMVGHVGW